MEFLRFQRTFYKKSFGPGLGAEAPTDNEHKKRGEIRVFYIVIICWNCRSKPPLLKFQETFLEKFLASGFGAEAPTFNAQTKKHGIAVLFYIFRFYQYIPPMPAPAAAAAAAASALGSFLSATTASVVRTVEATLAAF